MCVLQQLCVKCLKCFLSFSKIVPSVCPFRKYGIILLLKYIKWPLFGVYLWQYRLFLIVRFLYLSLGFVLTCLVHWLDFYWVLSVLCEVWRLYFSLHMCKMTWIIPQVEFQYRTKIAFRFFFFLCLCIISLCKRKRMSPKIFSLKPFLIGTVISCYFLLSPINSYLY